MASYRIDSQTSAGGSFSSLPYTTENKCNTFDFVISSYSTHHYLPSYPMVNNRVAANLLYVIINYNTDSCIGKGR